MTNTQKTILTVEDDEAMRGVIVNKLKRNTYQVLEAKDGKEAISLAVSHKPDLILLDLLLPEMDGFQVLEAIRKNPDPEIAGIPVIVLSNLWSDKDILRVRALRIDEYFVKANVSLEEVFEKAEGIMSKKMAQ